MSIASVTSRVFAMFGDNRTEGWLEVHEDGRLIKHVENDGYAYKKHGPQAIDRAISIEEVAEMSKYSHLRPSVLQRLVNAYTDMLAELRARI